MIYLDNAATSWPKPRQTITAVMDSLVYYGANPGRSGHAMSLETSKKIYECRTLLAEFFGLSAEHADKVIFTPGCTYSINFVIKGLLGKNDHVIVSNLEHNAVMRPIYNMAKQGVHFSVAKADYDDEDKTVASFADSIRRNTKMVICTHASNVTGKILPIKKIGRLCRSAGILFAVDCAQSAGLLDINMEDMCIDFLCAPAHKGLYGTTGLGVLICASPIKLYSVIQGGTGVLSAQSEQPEALPERLESGTANVTGICALAAGLDFVKKEGRDNLLSREIKISSELYNRLSKIPRVQLISRCPSEGDTVPIVLFNIEGMDSEKTAFLLDKKNIAVRAGLHCAPVAHKTAGTFPNGAVRICPSAFTRREEMEAAAQAIEEIASQA